MAASLRGLARLGGLGVGATLLTRDAPNSDGGHGAKRRPQQRAPPVLASGIGGPARCEAAALFEESKDSAGFVGVFLDRASVEKARSALGTNANLTRAPHALVHLHPDPATKEMFAPLFGAKVREREGRRGGGARLG